MFRETAASRIRDTSSARPARRGALSLARRARLPEQFRTHAALGHAAVSRRARRSAPVAKPPSGGSVSSGQDARGHRLHVAPAGFNPAVESLFPSAPNGLLLLPFQFTPISDCSLSKCVLSQTQMPQRQQPVIRVFAIQRIILPRPIERPLRIPQRVDEIEAGLLHFREIHMHPGQRVQRGGCREQIGQRRLRRREKSALGPAAREEPIPQLRGNGLTQLS